MAGGRRPGGGGSRSALCFLLLGVLLFASAADGSKTKKPVFKKPPPMDAKEELYMNGPVLCPDPNAGHRRQHQAGERMRCAAAAPSPPHAPLDYSQCHRLPN